MAGSDFFEEQRRRQRDLVAARARHQNPDMFEPEPPAPEIVLTPREKIKNFWFYNKYFVIAGLFFALVLSFMIAQCANRKPHDLEVVLFSRSTYLTEEIRALEEKLAELCPDTNGDGEVHVQIIDCSFSENENYDIKNVKQTKLTAAMAANNKALLYITDDEAYKHINGLTNNNIFEDIGLPLDDGKSVAMSKDFYDFVDSRGELAKLPEGLKFSLRRISEELVIGKGDDTMLYYDSAKKLIEKLK